MLQHEDLIKRFNLGLSILDSYIRLNGKMHLLDINIISESFMCELLNLLFEFDLSNANEKTLNNPGYDLISESKKVLVQVSSTLDANKIFNNLKNISKKIKNRNELLENIENIKRNLSGERREELLKDYQQRLKNYKDLNNYRYKFLYLGIDASNLRRNICSKELPDEVIFDPQEDILDFSSLSNKVLRDFVYSPKKELLSIFIMDYSDLFEIRQSLSDRVESIIKEYSDNYVARLFLHKYENSSAVTLENLYVDPEFRDISKGETKSRDMVGLICDFLWQKPKNDKERILFVEGDAAIGKTSLVSWLCYNYLRTNIENCGDIGKAIFLNRKIVCVRLRELIISEFGNPVDAILKYLNIKNLDEFRTKYRQSIIILDGADELGMVSGINSTSIESFIIKIRNSFSDHKIIVTTRPKFFDMSRFKDNHVFKIRHIVLLHFSRKMRMEWIEKYKACGEDISTNTQRYIECLSDEKADGVADTPLALYLLVRCDMREELQGNNWALFHEIFSKAIVEADYNENFSNYSNDLQMRKSEVNYLIVERIAFKMFENFIKERYYITKEEFDAVISFVDLGSMSKDIVKQTCVLCAYWKNSEMLGALEFYHNNIRDYFLCEFIYRSICCCIAKHIQDDVVDELIVLFCKIFSFGQLIGTTWEETFSFLYLRLKYECEHKCEGNTLISLVRNLDIFQGFVYKLLESKHIWSFNYNDLSYSSAKNVFLNSMMLLRIIYSFLNDDTKETIKLWKTEEEKNKIDRMHIIQDWCSAFKNTLKISNEIEIGTFSLTELSDIDLKCYDLEKSNFVGSNIKNSSFIETKLCGSTFANAILENVNFTNSDLSEADFTGAILNKVNFNNANLTGAKFKGAKIFNCVWLNSELGSNDFSSAYINNMELKNRTIYELCFIDTIVNESKFINCRLRGGIIDKNSCFNNTDFTKSVLSGIISDSKFKSCIFDRCSFNEESRIQDLNFEDCSFVKANFTNLTLSKINFFGSNFKETQFINTNLNLVHIDGENTFMEGANFYMANASALHINNINFYRVNLKDAIGFDDQERIKIYISKRNGETS